ncbi:hypothetical protein SAMN04488107_1435 [Geodermatophilus saharensis]|uniref:Uncharacterized protein n=1 Tax=Geodermatophilus saharensis TaxID=1137994 RepID=A0A239BUZ1_9ACTN|nr:hypothetical protein [Geodermatophilus saharensis]SNS11452.1 hypothetical protein SAMN04488107_1435 [Geodermatophilus saharensis]
MADLTIERSPERHGTGPAPDLRPDRRASGAPSPPSDGVALSRLLALARLTVPQALELAAAVLEAAAQLPVSGVADPGSGGPHVRAVVGPDGRVALHRAAAPSGRAVAAVLGDVAAAAPSRAGSADPVPDPLSAALDAAVADLPDAGVPAVARRLAETAAAVDRDAVRGELGALVRAIGAGGPVAAAPPAAVRAPVTRPVRREGSRTARRVGAWLLSVLVLAAVVTVEVVVLRDDIADDVDVLLDAGRSGVEPTVEPEPDGVPITPPAPAASGSVTGVDLRGLTGCEPGAPCTVRVQVRLDAGAADRQVTWSYLLVDRCTGATSTAPGGTVTVPAGGTRAEAVGVVALPPVPAVAVLAVTDLPAAAASAPLPVGSCPPELLAR